MTIPALPGRNLTSRELAQLVNELADRADQWDHLVAFPDGPDVERHYACLHRDEHVDVWLLCWTPASDTGFHDHDGSSGAVRVVSGAITESNPRIGGAHVEVLMAAGSSFTFGPDHIHRLTGSAAQSVSIHAYSPPLERMGQYTIDGGGVMRRLPRGYTDELRPVAVG
jgi:predicted metal-dependent enzyme (double-stranded beta helix superfamily)